MTKLRKPIMGELRVELGLSDTLKYVCAVFMAVVPFIPDNKKKEAKKYLLPVFKAIGLLYAGDPDFNLGLKRK